MHGNGGTGRLIDRLTNAPFPPSPPTHPQEFVPSIIRRARATSPPVPTLPPGANYRLGPQPRKPSAASAGRSRATAEDAVDRVRQHIQMERRWKQQEQDARLLLEHLQQRRQQEEAAAAVAAAAAQQQHKARAAALPLPTVPPHMQYHHHQHPHPLQQQQQQQQHQGASGFSVMSCPPGM